MTDAEFQADRLALLQGIQSALSGAGAESLPTDAATIRDVQAKPDHLRTQDERAALAGAQQRAMADLLRKPNSEVSPEEATAIRKSALEWMRDGDGK
jgi:hypothetical protein